MGKLFLIICGDLFLHHEQNPEGDLNFTSETEDAMMFNTSEDAQTYIEANELGEDFKVYDHEITEAKKESRETSKKDDGNKLGDTPKETPDPKETPEGEGINEGENSNEKNKTSEETDKESKKPVSTPSLYAEVKELRKNLDFNKSLISKSINSVDVEAAIFKSKAWLGRLLGHLGSENPYKNENKIKSRKDIPPTADTKDASRDIAYQFNLKNKEIQIIELRQSLKLISSKIDELSFDEKDVDDLRLAKISKTNAYTNLSEAIFLLGDELAKLKV